MEELGKKFDTEKPKTYLLPPKALMEISRVLTIGAEKYDEENWRKLDNLQNRYTGAALRHLFAHMDGEQLDSETNLSHIAHAVCCLLFKLEIEIEETTKKRIRRLERCEHSKSHKRDAYVGFFPPDYNKEGSMSDP